jgi:hypothetical protein
MVGVDVADIQKCANHEALSGGVQDLQISAGGGLT